MSFPTDLETIRRVQRARLEGTLAHALRRSPFYRGWGIDPHDVGSLDDFRKLPVTTKEDLRTRNFDFFAVPRGQWRDMLSTSGTTGSPVYLAMTRRDLDRVARYGAETLGLMGLTREDVVQLTLPTGARMWTAGYGFHLCYMRFGCCVLRFGPGFGEEQVNTMSALGATVLHAVPSFAATLGLQAAPRRGELKVRKVVTIGENVMTRDLLRNALGRKIEELWGVELFSTYGCTEGPFIAAECGARAGHHYHPYEVLVEVLDGETHRPVEPGELGVVAVTPLGVEGFPLLRYLTGDVSFLVPGECPCGVLTPRLGPIVARTDQRMKIKGAVVYPEAVKEIIRGFPEIDGFQIEVYTRGFVDELRVHFHAPCELASALSAALYGGLGISVEALPCTREEMAARLFPPDAGKPRVFLDDRRKPQRDGLPQQDGAPGR